jgi:hypothetical protein
MIGEQQQQQLIDRQRGQNTLSAILEWQQANPGSQDLGALQSVLQGQDYDPSLLQPILQENLKQAQINATKKPELSPAAKKIEEKKGEFIAENLFSGGAIEESRGTINRLKELSQNIKGLGGYVQAALGSPDATEFNALGLAAIEPVLKVFNPRGALPQAKVDMVKTMYAPTASDNRMQIEGKIKGLESFLEKGEKLHQTITDLYSMYGADIPVEAITNYEKESMKLIDEEIANNKKANKNIEGVQEQVVYEKLTNELARQNPGRIMVDPATGKKVISNGNRFLKFGE